ncbi:MAG: NADH-quinone oxidoreductase subunit NuoE [Chloroflexota bacterium]
MKDQLEDILSAHKAERGALITILQQTQQRLGYLPEDAVSEIARALGISASQVFGVATFYGQFRFVPPGDHTAKVCLGTSCYVRGAPRILEGLEERLGIRAGETTSDRTFNLETVACFGCCALSPVLVVDEDVHSRVTPESAKRVVDSYTGKRRE